MKSKDRGIEFLLRVPYAIEREGDLFVSSCPVLDVYSQGKSEKEALKNLVEAIQLFVETCYTMGTLEEVLTDCGLTPASYTRVVRGDKDKEDWLDVPLPLIAARKNEQARAC